VGRASDNLFNLLGVRPVLGRAFLPEEGPPNTPDGARVAILGHEFWRQRFGADQDVLGSTILLDGMAYQVVGVLPTGFRLSSDLISTHQKGGEAESGLRDLWIPLRQSGGNNNELLGRLSPGISIDQVRSEIQTLLIDGPDSQLARVVGRKDRLTSGFGTPLLVLLGGAGILLLVACVNVAGLLVGEATGRRREIAVRAALGAGRRRIVRQLLTESTLLGVMGAALGVLLAHAGTDVLLALAPPLPRLAEVGLSARVLFFAAGAGVGTGILFGMAPAASLVLRSIGGSLGTRGRSLGRGGRSLQRSVVSLQMGLTVILLVAGGLFGRSLLRLLAVDPGFDPEGLVAVEVAVPPVGESTEVDEGARAQQEDALFRRLVEAVEAVPGVAEASVASHVPFGGGTWTTAFSWVRDGETVWSAHWQRTVFPDYHQLMGIPLMSGRFLSETDGPDDPGAMLISESLARLHWPDESPLGVQVVYNGIPMTIVGVVGDVKKKALGAAAEATFYVSAFQVPQEGLTLVAGTSGDSAPVLSALRGAIRAVDGDLLIAEPTTLSQLVKESESDDRFRTVLMLTFALLATLLAAVGVFGVTARAVAARAREMGIRMALGARKSGLIGLVLRDSMVSACVGALLGVVGALWTSRLIEHLLFGVESRDPVIYLSVAVLLMLVSLGAAYLPAMRIWKIAPTEVIAEE
jgi:predicted permease